MNKSIIPLMTMSLSTFSPAQPVSTHSSAKAQPSFQLNLKVEKYQMDNGMTVLLHVDKKAPLVNYQTWYRVGSQDDPLGQTGMAHLFEHMMFRETKKRDGKDFIKDVESRGISYNAYTSFDRTVYYFNLPKTELEFIAELEAERMVDLAVNEKNLKLEQEIVKEERLMRYENKPQNIWIDLFETTFNKSNYRWPIIGYKKDINSVTAEDCVKFYNTFYAPNNAILVIAGPIHIEKTKKILNEYYGSLKSSHLPIRSYPTEPKQTKPRSKNLYREAQASSLALAYHIPKAGSQESYALEILSFILGGGKASRLYQLLVEKNPLTVSVQAMSFFLNNAGIFIISNALHPKKSLKSVEQLTLQELKNLSNQPIQPDELDRAKTNIVKSHVDSLKTTEGKASLLAYHEAVFHDYTHLFKELDRYNRVQVQDVLQVAKKYLKPNQQTLIRLYPKK